MAPTEEQLAVMQESGPCKLGFVQEVQRIEIVAVRCPKGHQCPKFGVRDWCSQNSATSRGSELLVLSVMIASDRFCYVRDMLFSTRSHQEELLNIQHWLLSASSQDNRGFRGKDLWFGSRA